MVSHASQSDRRIVGTPAEAASMDRPSRRALRLHPDDNQSPLGGLALISRFLWDKKRCQEPFRGARRAGLNQSGLIGEDEFNRDTAVIALG